MERKTENGIPKKAAVITVSDTAFAGMREDLSGPCAQGMLAEAGYAVPAVIIVADEREQIAAILRRCAAEGCVLIVTTGGTGFSKRDVTPEATKTVIERDAPGIAEAIRANSMRYTPRAMLSRGVAGLVGESLIINLPGSPKAVRETLEFLLPAVAHGLDILLGSAENCARKD